MRLSNRIICLLLCALTALGASGAALAQESPAGSWAQINQELTRPEGWVRIVESSPFQLGSRSQAGTLEGQALYETAFGSYPSLDGSTVAVPMAMEFARQHLGLSDDDLEGFVFFSTTHGAYERLIERRAGGSTMIASQLTYLEETHPVDLLLATEPSDDELALAAEHGVNLVTVPICYDAFVFITHVDNPIDSLTVEQVRRIYGGQIINWKEVGGLDEPIFAYQREANSGSQTAMENLVMQGRPLDGAESVYVTDGMGDLVALVGMYENRMNSLGYTYQYYIDTLYRSDTIKTLSIDGIAPTPENLRNASYPFTTCYYAVYRQDEGDAVAGQFAAWIADEEGQRCVAQAGYVPILEVD